jgi:hypothetical protein
VGWGSWHDKLKRKIDKETAATTKTIRRISEVEIALKPVLMIIYTYSEQHRGSRIGLKIRYGKYEVLFEQLLPREAFRTNQRVRSTVLVLTRTSNVYVVTYMTDG